MRRVADQIGRHVKRGRKGVVECLEREEEQEGLARVGLVFKVFIGVLLVALVISNLLFWFGDLPVRSEP